jgi:hypothetical protein
MENIEKIYKIMPEGWKEAAEEKKAMIRSRNIKTAEGIIEAEFSLSDKRRIIWSNSSVNANIRKSEK